MPPWKPAPTPGSSITMRLVPAPIVSRALPVHAVQPRPTDKLHVGCIGAGGFARGIIFPLLRSSTGLLMESVASSTGAVASSARTGFRFTIAESPSRLLTNPNLDAVFILTRHNSHAAYVESALKRGKRVFVEKPLAVNREQLEMVRTAYAERPYRKTDRLFSWWGSNPPFSPFTERLKGFLAGSAEPMLVHIRCNAGFIPSKQLDPGPGE